MSEIICYTAPSVIASREEQEAAAKLVVTRSDWLRGDWPKKKNGPIPRDDRDFVIENLLRGGDRLWVYSLDVLGDSRSEILAIFRALHGLGIPLLSQADRMEGDMKATGYAIALEAALARAEGRIRRRQDARMPRRLPQASQKTGGRPKALRLDEVDEAIGLRAQRQSWRQIIEHFASKGVSVGMTTLRKACAEKRVEYEAAR